MAVTLHLESVCSCYHAHHDAVNGRFPGKHHLIVGILVGARRLNPPKSPLVPSWDLSIVLAGLQRGLFELLDSVKLKFLSLRQCSWPRSLPSKGSGTFKHFQRVPCVRGGLLSRCPETPAWIRDYGSHHALPWSGGEPASTALGGVRSSLGIAVSRKSIAHICGPHPEFQKLWPALSVSRKGRLSPSRGWPTG